MIELNSGKTKVPFTHLRNSHLTHEFCAQNKMSLGSRFPHNVLIQHGYNFDPPCRLNYHMYKHPKHANIIATCSIKDKII